MEKISRDFLVQAIVKFYEIAEMRTKDETITQKTGFTETAEELLKVSKKDEDAPAASIEIFWNRLNAFFVALEYLNVCSFSKTSGPLRYIKELRVFEKEIPGLASMLLVDKLMRKKIMEIQEEDRVKFKTFSSAMIEVLDNHKYLWNDARTRCSNRRSSSPPKGSKRKIEDKEEETPMKTPRAARRAKARARTKELLKEAKALKKNQAPAAQGAGQPPPPPAPPGVARPATARAP